MLNLTAKGHHKHTLILTGNMHRPLQLVIYEYNEHNDILILSQLD